MGRTPRTRWGHRPRKIGNRRGDSGTGFWSRLTRPASLRRTPAAITGRPPSPRLAAERGSCCSSCCSCAWPPEAAGGPSQPAGTPTATFGRAAAWPAARPPREAAHPERGHRRARAAAGCPNRRGADAGWPGGTAAGRGGTLYPPAALAVDVRPPVLHSPVEVAGIGHRRDAGPRVDPLESVDRQHGHSAVLSGVHRLGRLGESVRDERGVERLTHPHRLRQSRTVRLHRRARVALGGLQQTFRCSAAGGLAEERARRLAAGRGATRARQPALQLHLGAEGRPRPGLARFRQQGGQERPARNADPHPYIHLVPHHLLRPRRDFAEEFEQLDKVEGAVAVNVQLLDERMKLVGLYLDPH
eukprot:scaffold20903_cov99-Isochrysis_galbana.AAC.7